MKRCALKRKTPLKRSIKPLKRSPIKVLSNALRNRQAKYRTAARAFLSRPENQVCPVLRALHLETVRTTDVHHTKGRNGKLLLDERYWLGVSRAGHRFIHSNPNEARQRGWLI